jgi:hypothetical protein
MRWARRVARVKNKRNGCISRLKGKKKVLRIQRCKQEQKLKRIYKSERTVPVNTQKKVWCPYKGKLHPCTGTEALYRPYGS